MMDENIYISEVVHIKSCLSVDVLEMSQKINLTPFHIVILKL